MAWAEAQALKPTLGFRAQATISNLCVYRYFCSACESPISLCLLTQGGRRAPAHAKMLCRNTLKGKVPQHLHITNTTPIFCRVRQFLDIFLLTFYFNLRMCSSCILILYSNCGIIAIVLCINTSIWRFKKGGVCV